MSELSSEAVLMLIDRNELIRDFGDAAALASTVGWPCEMRPEVLRAPQDAPKRLLLGFGAVYAFALGSSSSAPAGVGRVLKVGKAGANSAARFTSQHYSPGSAQSTLAGSILKYPILWLWLGITERDASDIKRWMLASLDRMHIFVRNPSRELLTTLELYVRARIDSVYEGSARMSECRLLPRTESSQERRTLDTYRSRSSAARHDNYCGCRGALVP